MAFSYVSNWLKDQSFLKGLTELHLNYESNWLKDQSFLKGLSEWHLPMCHIGSKIKAF